VARGIYNYTRNPMYLGMLLVLLALALYRASPWALAGPLLFIVWMNRFQIVPEERALAAKFGASFEAYRQRVRRWL
jgi:protein-S-isoprenylcysteine O-methyltransferase Ste14